MNDPDRKVWEDVLAHLQRSSPALCRRWFEEITPLGFHHGALGLRTETTLHRDYLRAECLKPINEAVHAVTGKLVGVRFFGPDDQPELEGFGREAREPRGRAAPARPGDRERQSTRPAGPARPGEDGTRHQDTRRRPAQEGADHDTRGDAPAQAPGGSDITDESLPIGHETRKPGNLIAAPASREPELAGRYAEPAPLRPIVHRSSEAPDPGLDGLVINPDYNFENFVIGPNNRLPHAAAEAVGDNPGTIYNPLFVHGSVGVGKTHLLQAVCIRIKEHQPGARIYYTSCEGFTTKFVSAVRTGVMDEFRQRFRNVDALVIDDIQFLAKRDRTQEEFFHTFNELYQMQKQIVLSSDAPPEQIPDVEERLVSRFKWGLVTEMHGATYETRIEILKRKALLRGLELPDEVACHVASRIDTNIRELEGAITRIQIHAQLSRSTGHRLPSISLELAMEALGEAPSRLSKGPTIDLILEMVADYYNVRKSEILGKRRMKSISLPRQVCMYLTRKHTRKSLQEIGASFGGRDHTTVMHSLKSVEEKLRQDPEFAEAVAGLSRELLQAAGRG